MPQFQRRQYITIARQFAERRANASLLDLPEIEASEDAMIKVFKADNARFNVDRFRDACKRAI